MAISGRYCRSERAIVKRHAPPICHCEERSDVAISSRYCRSVRAIVKTARTSDLSLRGAKRRGNLGKALPFGTSHRKTVRTSDLSLRGAKRRGNLGKALPSSTNHCKKRQPPQQFNKSPERQSRYETVLCLPFDQQRKYCPVHRHDKRPAKKIVRASGRPRGWLYKAILCPKISLF